MFDREDVEGPGLAHAQRAPRGAGLRRVGCTRKRPQSQIIGRTGDYFAALPRFLKAARERFHAPGRIYTFPGGKNTTRLET